MADSRQSDELPLGEDPIEKDEDRLRLVERMREFVFEPDGSGMTVDEISSGLRVSKKTLYRFFPSRKAILRSIVNLQFRQVKQFLNAELERDSGALEKIQAMLDFMVKRMGKMPVSFASKVRRLEPELYQELMDERWIMMNRYFGEVIRLGQTQGVLRKDLNPAILTRMLITALQEMAQPQVLQELDVGFKEVFQTVTDIILNGATVGPRGKGFLSSGNVPVAPSPVPTRT